MFIRIALLSLLISVHAVTSAQHVVTLMNGREMTCTVLGDSGTVLLVQMTKPSGRVISREIPKSDIFSVKKQDGQEQVYYAKDEML
jgi:hypothetical protein